jgi:hypothetical protein
MLIKLMLIHPHTLSLITTHRCTAACEQCCFGCTPKTSNAIPIPRLHGYLEQACDIPSLKFVVFTGGECFLLGFHLDDLIGKAYSFGFGTRFVSNGYWAHSPRAARKRCEDLVKRGLTEANFSTGDDHAKYVNPEFVRNGANEFANAGLTTVVMLELRKNSCFDVETFLTQDKTFLEHLEAGKIIIQTSPWMGFKDDSTLEYGDAYLDTLSHESSACTTVLRVLSITPTEDLIACCGLPLEEIPELHLGNLKSRTIKEIVSSTKDDFIKIWIHVVGPRKILQYAKSVDDTITPPTQMAHICDTCRFLYKNDTVRKVIAENPPPDKEDIIKHYFNTLQFVRNSSNDNVDVEVYKKQAGLKSVRKLISMANGNHDTL